MLTDFVRSHTTPAQRRSLALSRVRLRQPTAIARALPEFLIIGAQRAGTSSLYRHLSNQPGISRPLRKEVDYFSAHFDRPESWYRAHFPLRRPGIRTFEATPQYLVHPVAAVRVGSVLPGVKLVVMLRDPVARIRSQHAHMRSLGFEDLPLVEALEAEEQRITADLERVATDSHHNPRSLFRYGYLARSLYGVQLERWIEHHSLDHLHVGFFERLVTDPVSELGELHRFLDLPPPQLKTFPNASRPNAPADTSGLPDFVCRAIREDRRRLVELLGRDPFWPEIS